jgi:hypothetical protein
MDASRSVPEKEKERGSLRKNDKVTFFILNELEMKKILHLDLFFDSYLFLKLSIKQLFKEMIRN